MTILLPIPCFSGPFLLPHESIMARSETSLHERRASFETRPVGAPQPACARALATMDENGAAGVGLARGPGCATNRSGGGDRREAGSSAVVSDPDPQSGPRCLEVPLFVAPGKPGEHAWQYLARTRGAAVAAVLSSEGGC